MSELWLFEILTSEAEIEVEDEAEVKTSPYIVRGGLDLLPCKITAS